MTALMTVKRFQTVLLSIVVGLLLWTMLPPAAHASLHTYRERPGQVTVRSRQSLRDFSDRAWQATAFKRTQGSNLQGLYMRVVGFPGAVEVDRQQPITLLAPTGQQWQLEWVIDPQAQRLPPNVGQYDLQPLLRDVQTALPLEMHIPLLDGDVAEVAIAPFIVQEWLQVQNSQTSIAPVTSPLGE